MSCLSSSLRLLFISRLRCSLLCLLITLFYLFSSAPSLHLPFLFFLHASSFCPYLIFSSSNSLSPVLPLSPHLSVASPLLHLTIFYCYDYHLPLMLLFFFSSPLLSSAITQHSCVFPFQILSPCITTEVLLTIPVDYLCALAPICVCSFLPPPPHAPNSCKELRH